MMLKQKQINKIRKISYPLVSYLETIGNPHLKIIIDMDNVEVLEGIALIKEIPNGEKENETDFNPEKP